MLVWFIIAFVFSLILCVVFADTDAPILSLLFGAATFYFFISAMVVGSHPLSFDKDFTVPSITKVAEKENCVELVLRKGEAPVCITEQRKETTFKKPDTNHAIWPLSGLEDTKNVTIYRNVTSADVDSACSYDVKYDCHPSKTMVVFSMTEDK